VGEGQVGDARYYIQLTAEEVDDGLSWALELDDRGYVLREIGLDSDRAIRHRAPADSKHPRRGRIWDDAWFGPVGLRNDMTAEAFEDLWTRVAHE
jgi:hypothetical protein